MPWTTYTSSISEIFFQLLFLRGSLFTGISVFTLLNFSLSSFVFSRLHSFNNILFVKILFMIWSAYTSYSWMLVSGWIGFSCFVSVATIILLLFVLFSSRCLNYWSKLHQKLLHHTLNNQMALTLHHQNLFQKTRKSISRTNKHNLITLSTIFWHI